MWTPANKHALPSPENLRCAKKSIEELEQELEAAVEEVERAKLRVSALEKTIEERRAYIAPIRKLPPEILSEIFIMGSEMEDLAPVTITAVSRLWRQTILSTPYAWSFIDPTNTEHSGYLVPYISTFIARSNPCPLHISIPYDMYYGGGLEYPFRKAIIPAIDRIRCLSTHGAILAEFDQLVFPNLTRLIIANGSRHVTPGTLDRPRFPSLRFLDTGDSPWELDLEPLIIFPPLQYLSIQTRDDSAWEIIRTCAPTLKALEVNIILSAPYNDGVCLPLLESLLLRQVYGNTTWPIHTITPALVSYEEDRANRMVEVLHTDVKNVSYLRTDSIAKLSRFNAVRVLQVSVNREEAIELAELLERQPDLLPNLQVIGIVVEEDVDDSTEREFSARLKIARGTVEYKFDERWSYELPGSFQAHSCEDGMPCWGRWNVFELEE